MTETQCELSPSSRRTKLDPDVIYEEIGGFGKFQYFVYALICIPLIFIVCCNFSYMFIASDMDYRYVAIRTYNKLYCRCFVPECDVGNHENRTVEWITKAVPIVDGKLSKCKRLMPVSMNETDADSICPWNFNQSNAITCQNFVYSPHEHFILNEVKHLKFEASETHIFGKI